MNEQGYGYQNSEDLSSSTSTGGKFGLNAKTARLTKFEFNANAGKDDTPQDAIDIQFTIGEKEYNYRQFPITKVFGKNGELTDSTTEEYKQAKNNAVNQLNAVLSDIVKCYVNETDLRTALSQPISNFADYANILQRLVQSNANWSDKPLDLFLQYQWSPKGDNTRTFLELPKNVKHGKFVCASVPGEWRETRTATSLRYVDGHGNEHPIKRGEWFVGSPFANQTVVSNTADSILGSEGTGGTRDW